MEIILFYILHYSAEFQGQELREPQTHQISEMLSDYKRPMFTENPSFYNKQQQTNLLLSSSLYCLQAAAKQLGTLIVILHSFYNGFESIKNSDVNNHISVCVL